MRYQIIFITAGIFLGLCCIAHGFPADAIAGDTLTGRSNSNPGETKLRPIIIDRDVEPIDSGLESRGIIDSIKKLFTGRNDASLAWGTPVDGGVSNEWLVARLQIRANRPVYSMEDFRNVTKKFKCSKDKLEITFNNTDAWNEAKTSWASPKFLAITSEILDDSCGDSDGNRQIYNITSMKKKDSKKKIKLYGDLVSWEDFGQGSEFEFAFDREDMTGSSVHGKQVDIHKSFTFERRIEGDFIKDGYDDDNLSLKATCVDCQTKGKLEFGLKGKIAFKSLVDIDVTEAYLTIHPSVEATMKVKVQAEAKAALQDSAAISFEETNYVFPSPAGLGVAGLFSVGVHVDLVSGFRSTLQGKGEVTFGGNATLDGGVVELHAIHPNSSTAGEWEPKFQKSDVAFDGELTAGLAVYLGLAVRCDVSFFKWGAEIKTVLNAGSPTIEISAEHDDNGGVCENSNAKNGVLMELFGSSSVEFSMGEASGGVVNPDEFIDAHLASTGVPIFSTCKTIGGSASTAPVFATASGPSAVSNPSAYPTALDPSATWLSSPSNSSASRSLVDSSPIPTYYRRAG